MTAVQIHGAGRFAVCAICAICVCIQIRVQPGTVAGVSVVLVVVVTEVFDPGLGLVPTVRRHRRPAELERQQGEQDDGEEATHGRESSGYGVCLGITGSTEAWDFTISMRECAQRRSSSRGR